MRLAIPLLAALLAAGCASGGDAALPSSGWGGVVQEEPPPPEPLKGALSVPTPSVTPYPQREFTEEEKGFFAAAWEVFKAGDPRWPQAKGEWISLGPEATGVLAENLYRAMVASRAAGALHLLERARKELVLMGEGAVPILVGGLATRAVRTEDGEEIRVGQEVLHDAAEALSLVGEPAVPGLLDIALSGEKALVVEAAAALGNVGDPRAEETLLALATDGDWAIRAPAMRALRKYGSARVRDRLLAGLQDSESLVVERAAEALVGRKGRDALPGLVDALEAGIRDGRIRTIQASVWALRSLTGERFGDDPAAWRAWLERNRGG